MNSLTFLTIIFFPLFFLSTNPIYSQGFNCVTVPDETTIIAAGDSGKIYRSFDSGLSWNAIGSPVINYNSISSADFYTYLTAGNSRVYRTTTFASAALIDIMIPGNHVFNSVYFLNDSVGFVCGDNGIVFKTSNRGANWTQQNSGIQPSRLNSISFKDLNNGITAGDSGKVFITSDGGLSWTPVLPGTTKRLLKTKYFSDGIVISGEYGALFVKHGSSDWENINTRIISDIRSVTGMDINDVHICGGGGFIRNNRSGSSAFTNFESNPMMGGLTDINFYNSKTGYGVSRSNRAVIKTNDGGDTWQFTQGVYPTYIWERKISFALGSGNALCRHPHNRNTFFCGLGNRIYVSRNDGEDWSHIATVSSGVVMHSLYVSPVDTNIWVCAIEGSPDRIMRSDNYGSNWTISILGAFSTYGQPLEMDQNDPSVFYFAPDGGGFYKSTDNGNTFNLISNYPFSSPCDIIVMWDSSDVILLGDGPTDESGAKIFRSINSGVNWSLALDDSTGAEIPSMSNSVFEKNVIYSTEAGDNLFKSTDYGSSFHPFFEIGFLNWASGICEEDPTLIFDGMYGNSCYISSNSGVDWSFTRGVGNYAGLGILPASKDNILLFTTSGVYKLKTSYNGIVSVKEKIIASEIPDKFMLSQNYPNPFNPKTIISYQVPLLNFVLLKVFDVLGNEISTLVEGRHDPGNYEIEFNGSLLSSGIYFYSLAVGGSIVDTKRMVLLK